MFVFMRNLCVYPKLMGFSIARILFPYSKQCLEREPELKKITALQNLYKYRIKFDFP